MSERDLTDPGARGGGVVSGESRPPEEHTRRVEAAKKKKDAPTVVRVHDSREAPAGKPPEAPAAAPEPPSSTALSERARKERRRARDRRAERTAIGALLAAFAGLGVGAWYLLNSEWLASPPEPVLASGEVQPPPEAPRVVSSSPVETPDLPALRALLSEGLTVAAEGLPEVTPAEISPESSLAAAVESCRLAYGVWEFSPNKRFRFLPTCAAFEGAVFVGAYELKGSTLLLSPLTDGPVELVSRFEVEKPSRMETNIRVVQGGRVLSMSAGQRVTTLRGGMQGEAFHDTFAPKNTLTVPGGKPRPAPAAGEKKADPLLELIKQKSGP